MSEPTMEWQLQYPEVLIGDAIRENRKRAGLSRVGLAERAECAFDTVRSIESGRRRPSFDLAKRLLRECGARLMIGAAPWSVDNVLASIDSDLESPGSEP